MRNVPLEILHNVPKFRYFTLHFVLFAIENVEINDRASSMGALQHFDIKSHSGREWASMSLPGPSFPLDLKGLTSLYIGLAMAPNIGNLDLITRLINEYRNTLEDLGISFSEEGEY